MGIKDHDSLAICLIREIREITDMLWNHMHSRNCIVWVMERFVDYVTQEY